MGSNSLSTGPSMCDNLRLLIGVLHWEWKFPGYVQSDSFLA